MKGIVLLIFLSVLFASSYAFSKQDDVVLLNDIPVLTFNRNELTDGRRMFPVPRLTCIGGNAKQHQHEIKTVQCLNMDYGYFECHTNHGLYEIGVAIISCEGYEYPDDPYVLKDSCHLEYELNFTPKFYRSRISYKKNTDDEMIMMFI